MKLYLVRHGQTDLNKAKRYQGRIDVSINETGGKQVKALSARLSSEPIDKILASPLKRTQETAKIIQNSHNIDITTIDGLVEMDFGQLEGKNYEEIIKMFPNWEPSFFDFTFAGGENLDSLVNRMKTFLESLAQQNYQNVLVVSHSGCLRILLCLIMGIDTAKWWQFKSDQSSLTIIEKFPESPVLVLMNDTSHLHGE